MIPVRSFGRTLGDWSLREYRRTELGAYVFGMIKQRMSDIGLSRLGCLQIADGPTALGWGERWDKNRN